jgi:sigma-B regulation protein RsbU (phosphoserine phosphatase)
MCSAPSDRVGPTDEQPRVLSVVVTNELREISRLGQLVDRFGREHHLAADDTNDINLMLDEIVGNVIKHGFDDSLTHEIHIGVTLDKDLATVRVEDEGKLFNPLDAPEPDLDLPIEERPVGGLGVFIVRSIAESLDYRREGGRNIVTMKKRISAG